ncbi:hypothetical protein MFIFM68171_02627 [Madurella fahalii]|uniref:Aromatic amino acid beta-eliminating lyase/threonine aldolase domain-containing protein n=1 Tax=Madurella fahalii TaxID=1157608 RepID=A0ABQ0G3V4_9PEZI
MAEIAPYTDAMTLCFAKGVGALIGVMVVGSAEVIERVKRLRQSVGGGAREVGLLAAAVREVVLDNFGAGTLLRPTETNMVWLDLATAWVTAEALNDKAMRSGILLAPPRIVFYYQICAKAIASLEQLFDDVLPGATVDP